MIITEGTTNYLKSLGDETVRSDLKNYPLGKYGSTDDISAMVIYLMNEGSAWVTGQDFIIDGGRTLK
jgi:NAD(P)-dependent dehydrogenase (short-subunit alcohol dehydrogenase family)